MQGGSFQTARGTFSFTGNVTALNGGASANQYNSLGVITSTFNPSGQMPGSGGERWFWFAGKIMF